MDLTAGTRVDRWVVESFVARGGMASVYRVRHVKLGSVHALKVLHPEFAPLEHRLLGEGRAQSSLTHPNIVAVTDMVEFEGRIGLIMEWVEGPSLADWLAQGRRLTTDQLDVIGRDLLRALAVAHEAGWVHRDLKPDNVMLKVTGDSLVPKITDFGIAKQLFGDSDRQRTETGRLFGTPGYMAPEQMKDSGRVDARADLFALGVMLYELGVGRRPFAGDDPYQLFVAIARGEHVPLGRAAPELPARFDATVEAAIVMDPDGRVPSAEAMLALWTHEAGRGRPAPPDPWRPEDLAAARAFAQAQVPTPTQTARQPPEVRGRWARVRRQALAALGGGLVALASSAVALFVLFSESPTSSGVPVVSDVPTVQRRFELGWEQWADARFRSAEQTFRSVAVDAPESPVVPFMIASTRFVRGWFQPALEALDDVEARLRPEDDALAALVETYRVNQADGDLEAWRALAAEFPEDLLVQMVSCYEVGRRRGTDIDSCGRARALDDTPFIDWVQIRYVLGGADHLRGKQAVKAFLDRNPGHPAGLAQLSSAHGYLGEWEEAEAAARAAIEADPQSPMARIQLARTLAHLGDEAGRREQVALATSAAQATPDRVLSLMDDAETSLGLGQSERALQQLREAAALARAERDWHLLAYAQSILGQFGRHLDDPDVMAEARRGLAESAAAPEVAEANAEWMQVSLVYLQGLEAAMRGDLAVTVEARDRLQSLRTGWYGWLPMPAAVAVLAAYADDLAGDDSGLRTIAEQWPGCEMDWRGGEWLIEDDQVERGLARLRHSEETCSLAGMYLVFRYNAVERLLAHAEATGDDEGAARWRATLAELRPTPSP